MIEVLNAFTVLEREKIPSNPGNQKSKRYTLDRSSGSCELILSGEVDLPTLINSYADDCDIHNVIAKYGDPAFSPYAVPADQYGDASSAPETLADVVEVARQYRQDVSDLAVKFGISLEDLDKALVDDQFFRDLIKKLDGDRSSADTVPAETENSEVIADESK